MESTGMPEASGRDYGTGLVLFGLFELLVGLLFLAKAVLFALLSIPGMAPAVGRFGGDVPLTAILALVPAAFFVALGFGSIAARRWARSLSLAFSLVWLALGILCLAFGLVWVPKIIAAIHPVAGEAARSARQTAGALARVGAVAATVAFVLPAASAIFYGNAGVARECERRDPQARWTDRVPTGVLALIVVLGLAALLAFQIGFSTARQRLYFGHALGIASRAGWAALGVAEIAVAWGLARMRRWAWPAALGVIVVRSAASLVVTRRLAEAPDAMRIFAPGRTAAQSQALLEAFRVLRPFDALTLFFAVISAAALALAIGVGPAFRRRAPSEPARD